MEETVNHFHGGAFLQFLKDRDAAALAATLVGAGFDATTDFPATLFWEELLASNRSARVILTVRDSPEAWAESFRKTIGSADRAPGPRNFARAPFKYFKAARDLLEVVDWLYDELGIEFDATGAATTGSAIRAYEDWVTTARGRRREAGLRRRRGDDADIPRRSAPHASPRRSRRRCRRSSSWSSTPRTAGRLCASFYASPRATASGSDRTTAGVEYLGETRSFSAYVDSPWTGRGDAAAATWIFRGGVTMRPRSSAVEARSHATSNVLAGTRMQTRRTRSCARFGS